ncbi:hypothetical protein Tco_0825835 [Tanacetum coccineum]
MSLGKGIPSDLSLGNTRWGSFVRDSFPSEEDIQHLQVTVQGIQHLQAILQDLQRLQAILKDLQEIESVIFA